MHRLILPLATTRQTSCGTEADKWTNPDGIWRGCPVKIETATADELYRLLLDIQDRLGELLRDDRLTLMRDAEQIYGSARNAAGVVAHHLDEARRVLVVLETRD